MRMRALLALLVLLGMLPVQGGTGAGAGRAELGPTVLYLDSTQGAQNLSVSEPASNGSVVLGMNGTANFTVAGLSGLYRSGADWFVLDLSLVSLNLSGMELDCRLDLDYYGNASRTMTLAYQKYTTTTVLQTEHALVLPETVDHDLYDAELRNGSLRLELARVDSSAGLLEVLCGNGQNASALSVPYGDPLRADAGPDRSARTNRTVELNASLSESVDPAATGYLWNFGNGMTGAGQQVTAVYDRPGVYNVTLTLRWNGLEASDTAVVSVTDNRPPTADAGRDITTKRAGENITFRGGGSDPEGDAVSYGWSLGDGTNTSGRNVTHSYRLPGNYTVVLTVRDDGGAEGKDSLTVHINYPPVIYNLTASREGALWHFSADARDPDGALLRYNWSFGDGSLSNATRPAHSYNATGTYRVQCRVTDEGEDSASQTMNVTVTNAPPVISSLGLSGTAFSVNAAVRFRPEVYDADSDTLSYSWDFGDGATSTDRSPNHYYTRAGTFTVTLRVSDGNAMVARSETVQISESSDGSDSALWALLPCILIFVIILIITVVRSAAEARKRQEQGGQYGGGRYQPYGGLPSATQPYGGGQYPTYGTPQYQPYGGAQYQPYGGAQYPAAPSPPRAPRPPKAPPGVCPRCGSTDQQRFPDGHAKCNNCKKIFFTG